MGTTDRVHALDATRAFALILGIVLHASMSFFAFLPAQDVSRSTVLAGGFFTIHLFRMSLFFVLAGFFARLAIERRGSRGFVADRAKRIGVTRLTIAAIEAGKYSPTLEAAFRIAQVFKVPLDEVFQWETKPENM